MCKAYEWPVSAASRRITVSVRTFPEDESIHDGRHTRCRLANVDDKRRTLACSETVEESERRQTREFVELRTR